MGIRMKKLDVIDYKLLDILQKNSHITNQKLSKQVGLAPSSCLQRVRRLEESGYISGYHARVNLNEVCRFVTCIADVKLKSHSQQEMKAFIDMVDSIPEIVEYYTVNGVCDYILKIITRDMARYLAINDQLIGSSQYAATINTHVVLNENKSFTAVDLDTLR